MWFESLFVSRNNNERATELLLHHIAADSSITALVHLGDVTESSSRDHAWHRIDSLFHPLLERKVALYGTMGNHDYLFSAMAGEKNFIQRFPAFQRLGSVTKFPPLALILLNSNFSNLTDEETARQLQWYNAQLDSLDRDTTITMVVVGCHHPPFTNNTVIDPSKEVETMFVPPFLRHGKCLLFLSGHSHAFEHFQQHGKDFLVLGGGGGLQHSLRTGERQRWQDKFPFHTEKRMFHYLRADVGEISLVLTILMLKEDFSEIVPVYTITLSPSEKVH